MAKEYKIEIEKRELTDNLKQLRSDGRIPGVYYSHNSKESILFKMQFSQLKDAIKSGAAIFKVSVGGKLRDVIFKSVQYHPVQEIVQHIDLYGVDMKRVVTVKVAIHLTGTALGVIEEGGVLVQSLNELVVECLPADIPDSVQVDISELNLGDSIKVADITISDKLELKTAEEQTIASVTHAIKEEELAPAVEEDEEFMEEGEEGEEGAEGTEEGAAEDSSKEASKENKENTEG